MRLLIPIFILLSSIPSFAETVKESPAQVWKVEGQQWTAEREQDFARWVEENMTEDFFIRHKIPVDCADVPYAVRWIYARIAHLPAAATTKNNKLIGHWSTDWGHLPTHPEWSKDLRFRKALFFMLSETTTRTMPNDTYPIRIDPDSVTPGTPFFITESHSGVIGRAVLDGSSLHPLQTWESTSPAKIQKLNRRTFLAPRPESTIYSGLVKFRWPVYHQGRWTYLPVNEHPFYSLEQYTSDFYEGHVDYTDAVGRRIDPSEHDPNDRVDRLIDAIARYLVERITIVSAGFQRCHRGGCQEGSDLWETYSTPGRDAFITLMMNHLHQLIQLHHLDEGVVKEKMENIFLPIMRDYSLTFFHVYQNYPWLSHEPEDSIEARWGLRKCDMIFSQIQGAKSSIIFIERAYRKKDPKYASFAVSQQQEILRGLWQEWVNSECKEPSSPPKKNRK